MNGKIYFAALATLLFAATLPAYAGDGDPAVVKHLDIKKYSGLWYEAAHSPNLFQGGCERSTTKYAQTI
jgi:lipocalin